MARPTLSGLVRALGLAAAATAALADPTCNGRSEYCGRIWSNVSQVGSHDSAFVGPLPTQNQYISPADQLAGGVRFLQARTHVLDGALQLCHTSCVEENGGTLADYLATIKGFLDSNPAEVLTLLLTNGDFVNVSMFNDAMSAAGLVDYAYVPPGSPAVLPVGSWPTLGDMISSGKRLVFFLDYDADMATYPYILDEFAYFFENPYDNTDPSFANCSVDRPPGASPDGRMYIVNHYLDFEIIGIAFPDSRDINTTNAADGPGSIGAQVFECAGMYGHAPKGVLLDYINEGQALTAELAMNGLS